MKYIFGIVLVGMIVWAMSVELVSASLPLPKLPLEVGDRECEDVLLVFARASGHNRSGYTPDPYDGIFSEVESESHTYFTQVEAQLNANGYGDLSVDRVSLHNFTNKYAADGYRAVKIFSASSLSDTYNGIRVQLNYNGSEYAKSVSDGAVELKGFLEDQLNKCPNQLSLVGGFSQGANVVGDTMWLLKQSGLDHILARIDHIDLFGDPKFYGFDKTGLLSGKKLEYARGNSTAIQTGTLGPRKPYLPDQIAAKSTSWCDKLDAICSGFTTSDYGLGLFNNHSDV